MIFQSFNTIRLIVIKTQIIIFPHCYLYFCCFFFLFSIVTNTVNVRHKHENSNHNPKYNKTQQIIQIAVKLIMIAAARVSIALLINIIIIIKYIDHMSKKILYHAIICYILKILSNVLAFTFVKNLCYLNPNIFIIITYISNIFSFNCFTK